MSVFFSPKFFFAFVRRRVLDATRQCALRTQPQNKCLFPTEFAQAQVQPRASTRSNRSPRHTIVCPPSSLNALLALPRHTELAGTQPLAAF
jgi:hypothetical protein